MLDYNCLQMYVRSFLLLEVLGHKASKQTNRLLEFIGFDRINSFLASGDICHLLKTIANCLDSDQDRHNVGPDLDPNCLTL